MRLISIDTPFQGLIDITGEVNEIVRGANVTEGICQVFVPHTTAGVTINENTDPAVVSDILAAFEELVPKLNYQHCEGNSPAHIKTSLVGNSVSVPIFDGKLYLGTWQGIYLCEFDGPRQRKVCIHIV